MAVWILSSSVTILLVLLIRVLFRRWIRPTVKYALWLLVLLRLLIPFSVGETILSAEHLYRELPKWEVQAEITLMTGEIFTGEYAAADSEPSEDSEEPLEYYQTVTDRWITKGGSDAIRLLRIIWLTGCAVVGTVLLSNLHFFFRLRKTRRKTEFTEGKTAVYVTDAVTSPCLFGFPVPSIYLTPDSAADENLRKYILAHEYTHYRTGDHLFAFLRCVCLTVHWYNPLVWIAAVLSRQDGEESCDAVTIRRLGEEERIPYGKVLLTLASASRKPVLFSAAAGAVSQSKKQITGRIHALVRNQTNRLAAVVLLVPLTVLAVLSGYTGIRTERLPASIPAPDYVKKAALAWGEDLVREGNEAMWKIYEEFYEDDITTSVWYQRGQMTDWRISGLTPMGTIAPVCGREIEIWEMEFQYYAEIMRGKLYLYDYETSDGSGWSIIHNRYYLVFDAETKEELWRYNNLSRDEEDEFYSWLTREMRYYEKPGRDFSERRNIAGMSLTQIASKLRNEDSNPFHYVDRVCYKVEFVQADEGTYGREEIWRVIVNDTGEELGRVLYFPEHDDITILKTE